jgi:MFS family permease
MSTTTAQAQPKHQNGMYIALIPWVLFTIIAEHSTLKVASIVSLVLAIGIALPGLRAGRPKAIEIGAALAFAGFTIAAFAVDINTAHWLTRYARAIAAALLALIAFGSLLFTPFTEQYAREQVPQQFWGSPRFKAVNRRLTVLWGGVFALMVVSHIIAGTLNRHSTNIVFNWVIPILLVLAAIKKVPEIAHEGEHGTAIVG